MFVNSAVDTGRGGEAGRITNQSRKNSVLPWVVSARTFTFLWALLLVLIAGGIATMFVRVPIYAAGTGIIADWRESTQYPAREMVVIAFLPPETLSRLERGRPLLLQFNRSGLRLSRQIIAVESKLLDAATAQQQFALSPGSGLALPGASAVAIAELGTLPEGLSPASLVGRVVRTEVEVRSRRVGSFIPVVGTLFRD